MAVFPIAPGLTDLSSTSSNGITPIKWIVPFIKKNNAISVYEDIANMDIDSQEGDSFVMSQISSVTVSRNKAAGAKVDYEFLTYPKVTLNLDQAADFAFAVDDVQAKQANKDYMTAQAGQAAIDVMNDIDTNVLGTIYSDADADNTVLTGGGTLAGAQSHSYNVGGVSAPLQITTTNVIDFFVNVNAILDEAEAPQEGRFCVVPPWMNAMFLLSDLKNASVTGDTNSILKGNGRVGYNVGNVQPYVNSHLSTTTDSGHTCWRIVFGVKGCFHFAQQLKKFEEIRDKDYWETFVRGKETYGFEVSNAENLGTGLVYKV